MNNANNFFKEQLARPEVKREYARLAPFYRLAGDLILLRKKRGLSQQELAEKANTTQAVVSRLENVAVHCSLESVIRLADALGAAVEVRLTPLEDYQALEDTDQPNQKDCIEPADAAKMGKVYFGKSMDKSCSTLEWFRFDLRSSQVDATRQSNRQKKAEIA